MYLKLENGGTYYGNIIQECKGEQHFGVGYDLPRWTPENSTYGRVADRRRLESGRRFL